MLVKTKSQNEQFLVVYLPRPPKKIQNGSINYSFGELVFGWNDTIIGLKPTWYCSKL